MDLQLFTTLGPSFSEDKSRVSEPEKMLTRLTEVLDTVNQSNDLKYEQQEAINKDPERFQVKIPEYDIYRRRKSSVLLALENLICKTRNLLLAGGN